MITIKIDADMDDVVEFENIGGRMIPSKMAREIALTQIVDKKYRFDSERGAAAYLNMIGENSSYAIHREASRTLEKNIDHIMGRITGCFRDAGCKTRAPAVIALGTGGADRTGTILEAFMHKYENVSFTAVEHSRTLLFYGLHRLRKRFYPHVRDGKLAMNAILGNYAKNKIKTRGHKLVTVLMAIHNMVTDDFFDMLEKIVDKKTLVLLDVEMVDDRTDHEMCAEYESDELKRFVFSPLEMLGDLAGYGEEFEPFRNATYDPKTIAVQAVTHETMGRFADRYGLPIRARGILQHCLRDKPKVIIPTYEPKKGASYVLGHTARFEKIKFHAMLDGHGYVIVGEWWEEKSHGTYYLIARRDGFFK